MIARELEPVPLYLVAASLQKEVRRIGEPLVEAHIRRTSSHLYSITVLVREEEAPQ